MSWLKLMLKGVGGLIGLFLLYVLIVLIHGTFTDYQPEKVVTLPAKSGSGPKVIEDSILSFAIWNVGYGGLGEESNFFYDNSYGLLSRGRMIRSPKPAVEKNIAGMTSFVASTKADFFLFQEVDFRSKRSYYINQYEAMQQARSDYSANFTVNYQVKRVPVPVLEPWRVYGATKSGLATYGRFQPTSVTRLQLPGTFSWPTRIFQLDRCLLVNRYQCAGGKELVVINLHHSAYDAKGDLKQVQMNFLRDLVLEEYQKGNYVIAGGDWNLCPPFFRFDGFAPGKTAGYNQFNIEPDFLPDTWRWIYDTRVPTNRKTKTRYEAGETFVTLIDFFLVSPNINVLTAKGINQGFRFSDHQPVWMEIELKI